MKKSTVMLIVGILLIVADFIADAIVSNTVLDFSGDLEVAHFVAIGVAAAVLLLGIGLIIYSRIVAKKEKK